MPTYEFRCPDGHTFDRFYRKMGEAVSELPCPDCGKPAARVMSGGAGLVFKGSGFYLTDYGKNAHRGDNGGSRPASAQADGAPPPSSDSGSGGSTSAESAKSDSSKSESKTSDSKSSDSKSSDVKASDKSTGAKAASTSPSSSAPKSDK